MARGDFYVEIDKRKLDSLISSAPKAAAAAIKSMAFDGERDVKQSFSTSPSAPGSTPGVDTGALRSSINTRKISEFLYEIRTGVDYGAYLEFGTSRMAARPFMGPMALRLQKNVKAYFGNLLD